MRSLVLACVFFSGCLSFRLPKPPPKVAETAVQPLNVHFLGAEPNRDDLYVCGWLGEEFSCYEYVFFQEQMRR